MAVTFGCPLVGTYNELCGKHLKVGQRAYATDGQSEVYVHEGTNWKTGAVDENGNLIVYERLPWDINMGGDNEVNPSNYYTKEEIDDKLKDEIFTFTCDLIENPETNKDLEIINLFTSYEEIYDAYEKGKIIKAVGNLLDKGELIFDLTGFTDDVFYFSTRGGDSTLDLCLGETFALAFITYLQHVDNMLQKIEGNENIDDYYPSVKAVADYVAKYGGGDVVIPIISWDEANELLSTGIYRVDNGNATSILISSLLEQQARQVLITGDEFSSRYKTKNIETNEWGDWSAWNYFTTSEDFQNAINFVNETLANYYTKEEVDEKDGDIRATAEFALGQVTNFQYDLDLKENLSNKTNTISDQPSMDKYPSEVAVFEKFMSFDNDIKSYIFSYTTSQFYTKDQTDNKISDAIGNIESALENIIAKYGLGGDAS